MSNLAFIRVEPSNEYQNLSELSGVTFTKDKKYLLQVKGSIVFCQQNTLPTEGGIILNTTEPYPFVSSGDTVYIKVLQPYNGTDTATINISEEMMESGGGGGSITVDQTYDPTSSNAQSGTAVAGALETITWLYNNETETLTIG